MKKWLFIGLILLGANLSFGQKYAYIDSDYILAQVPAYAEAKSKLDKLAERWTKEIEDRMVILNKEERKLPKRRSSFACRRKKETCGRNQRK